MADPDATTVPEATHDDSESSEDSEYGDTYSPQDPPVKEPTGEETESEAEEDHPDEIMLKVIRAQYEEAAKQLVEIKLKFLLKAKKTTPTMQASEKQKIWVVSREHAFFNINPAK